MHCPSLFVKMGHLQSLKNFAINLCPTEMTKLTQELAVKLEQGETSVSGTQWQTEE